MKSSQQIEKVIGRAQARAGQETDERILKDAVKALTNSTINRPQASRPGPTIWRIIMESKVTKYSAAAVIVLAITLVLLSPFGTPGNGSIVLANVQQKVADAETMVIRGQKIFTCPGENGELFEFDGIPCKFDLLKHFSKQYGLVEEGYVEGRLIYRITFNRLRRRALVVLPPWKKYLSFTSTDEQGQLLASMTPKGIIDMLLGSDYKEMGRNNIDNVEVVGFEFQDANPIKGIFPKAVFDIQNIKGKVWIGTKEQLPVRIEADLFVGKSLMTAFHDLNLNEVNILDEYNFELDENIFDIAPPEGYTEITLSDILQTVPTEAKAGAAAMGIIPVGLIVWRRQRKKTKADWHK